MPTDDNLTTVSCHTPLKMEEDMATHVGRRHKVNYVYQVASHMLPK
jgi:hypothetical protein